MKPAFTTKSSTRLYVLLAAKEPVGVIFRRGPSKQVLLIRWNTRADTFETGQWFKGRVYERRCDLSPDGTKLIYFAANQKPPLHSWTAISKPPFFTALALWPKGDCWNGGGWFVSDKQIRLNHSPVDCHLHPDFKPGPIKIAGHAEFRGEDATVWNMVRQRDGWQRLGEGKWVARGGLKGWTCHPPERWIKPHPKFKNYTLEMAIVGLGGQGAPWYQINYRVIHAEGVSLDLGQLDWADWDHRRDLVFAHKGCLFRRTLSQNDFGSATQIADFNALKFEEVPATHWAKRWK